MHPAIAVSDVGKRYGSVVALEGVTVSVHAGTVTCLLGDNGAGKSTLVKVLSGVEQPTSGRYEIDGEGVRLGSPLEARAHGIATVYQDLAVIPLMSVWRNFFLGSEPTRGWGPLRRIDVDRCAQVAREELERAGIDVRDPSRPMASLSGGERQAVAVARALYFGAKVLILDEPTAALGVRQSGILLEAVERAKRRGVAVVFVTHNPLQAHPVGDRFVVLQRGRVVADAAKDEVSVERLTRWMAGAPGP